VSIPAELMMKWAIEQGGVAPARMERLLQKWAAEGPEPSGEAEIPFRLQATEGQWTIELMLSSKRAGELAEATGLLDPIH
jgi:hypothetical protein